MLWMFFFLFLYFCRHNHNNTFAAQFPSDCNNHNKQCKCNHESIFPVLLQESYKARGKLKLIKDVETNPQCIFFLQM